MGRINTYVIFFLAALGLLVQSCVEPYEFETEVFDSALVVEGTITNEEINQKIMISTTYKLEENGPVPLRNANLNVKDNTGMTYSFQENSPGIYLSTEPFKAEEGRSYQLEFTTSDGRSYASDPAQYSGSTIIEDIFAQRIEDLEGNSGVEIRVNSRGTSGSSGFYRYEYEETYKIVSPFFKSQDIILDQNGNVNLVPKSKEEFTCFKTETSRNIVISNTNTLSEDNVRGELLRFIRKDNPIFAHRYSILVKQYVISREAYSFYQTLKDLSESESLFSQIQPGYLSGNIYSLDDENENVLGFFSVSSVTEKREYFNYSDFYGPGEGPRPTFTPYCPLTTPTNFQSLVQMINDPGLRFFEDKDVLPPNNTPSRYVFVTADCVDCTLVGDNVAPDFWEE